MVAVSLKKVFFKQKTAYEIPKRDWSSDVCSSDLILTAAAAIISIADVMALAAAESFQKWTADP